MTGDRGSRDSFLRDLARAFGLRPHRRTGVGLGVVTLLVAAVAPLAVIAAPPPPPAPPTVSFQNLALGTAVGVLSGELSSADMVLPLDELPNAWTYLPSVTDNVPSASFEIAVDDERMLVAVTGSDPYVFTLTRGHAGTEAVDHATDAVVYRLWPEGQTPLVTAGNAAHGVKVMSDLVATGFGEVRTEVLPGGWLAYDAPEGAAQCFYDPPGKTPGEFRTVNEIQTWTKTVYGYDSQGIVVGLPGVDDVELEYDFALERASLSEVVPVSALGADGIRSVDIAARITQREFRRIYEVDELRYRVPNKAAVCYPAAGGALSGSTVTFTQDEQQVVSLYGLDKPVSEIQRVDLTGRLTAGQTEAQSVRLEGMNAGTDEVQTASGLDFEGAIAEVQTVTLTGFSAGVQEVQRMALTSFDANGDTYQLRWNGGTPNANVFKRGGSISSPQVAHTAANLKTAIDALLAAAGVSATVSVSSVSDAGFTVTYSSSADISEHLQVVNGVGSVSGSLSETTKGSAGDSFKLTYGGTESTAITLGPTQTEVQFEAAVLAAIDDIAGAPTPTSVDATGFTLGSTVGGLVVTFPGAATPLSVTSAVGTSGSVAITRDGQDSDVLQLTYDGGSAFPSPGLTMAPSGTTATLQSALQSAVRTATGRSDATVSVTGSNGSASAAGTITGFTVTFPTFDAASLALASTGVAGSVTTTTPGGTASRFTLRVTVPGTSAGEYTTATLSHPVSASSIKTALDAVLPNQGGSASKVDVAATSTGSISGSLADFTVTFSDWPNTDIASTLTVCTADATPVCPGSTSALGVSSVASSVTTEGKAESSFTVSYGASMTSPFGPGFAGNAMTTAIEGLAALDIAAVGSADVTVSDVSNDGFTVAFVAPSNTDVDALTVTCTNCPTGVETITATTQRQGSSLNEQFTLTFDVDTAGGPVDETQAVTLTDFDGADGFRVRVGGNTAAATFAPGYGTAVGVLEAAIEDLIGAGADDVSVTSASDSGFLVTFSGAQGSSDVAPLVIVPGAGSAFTSAVTEAPKGSHSPKTSASLNGSLFSDASCLGAGCPAATATAITGALEALTPLADPGLPTGASLDVTISDARTQAPVDEEQRVDLVGFDGSEELSLAFGDGAASIVTAGGTYTRAGLAAALSDALESDTGVTDPTADVVGLVASGGSTDCGTSADPLTAAGFCFTVRGSLAATDVPSVVASGSGFTVEVTDLAPGTPTFDTFTVRFGGEFVATDYLPLVVGGSTFTTQVSEKVKGTRGRPTIQFLDSTQLEPVSAARDVLLDLEAPTFNDLAAIDPSTLGEGSPGGTVPIALESSDGQANLPVEVEVAAFPVDGVAPGSVEPAFASSFDDTFDANGELSAQIEFGIPCDVLPGEYLLRATIGERGEGLGMDLSGLPFLEPASTTIGVLDVRPALGIETNAGVYGAILNSVTGEFGFQNLYGTGGLSVTASRKKVTTTPGTLHATGFASLVGACAPGDISDGEVTVDFDAGIDEVQTVVLPGGYKNDPSNSVRLRLDRSNDPTDAFPDVSDPILAGDFTESAIEEALLAMGEDVVQDEVDEVQRITLQNFGAECDLFTIAVAGGEPQAIKKSDPLCSLVDGQREYADTDIVDALVASGAVAGTVEIDGLVTDGGFSIRFIGAAGGVDQPAIEVVCPEFCEPTVEEVAKGSAAASEPRDELVVDVDRVITEGNYSFRVTFLGADAGTDVPMLTVYDRSGFSGTPTVEETVKGAAESVDLTLVAPRGFEFIKTGRQYARVFAGAIDEGETFSYERPGDTLTNLTRQLIAKDGSGWEVLSARDPVTGAQTLSIKLDGIDAGLGIGRMPADWKVFVSARVRFVGTTVPVVCQPYDFASTGRYEGFLDVDPKTPDDDEDLTVLRTSSGEPVIVTSSLPEGTAGSPYAAPLDARFGSGTYAFSAEGLPSGLAIDATSGVISGTPEVAGISTVTVTVEDVGTPLCGATTRTYVLEVDG